MKDPADAASAEMDAAFVHGILLRPNPKIGWVDDVNVKPLARAPSDAPINTLEIVADLRPRALSFPVDLTCGEGQEILSRRTIAACACTVLHEGRTIWRNQSPR